VSKFRKFLFEVSENDLDTKIRNRVKFFITNELDDFEFLMTIII
jgi:hypothetical protein